MTLKKISLISIFFISFQLKANVCEDQNLKLEKIPLSTPKNRQAPACFNHLSELRKISADELAIRLIFAETVAANCKAISEKERMNIFTGIALVIYNRSQHPEFRDKSTLSRSFINETQQQLNIRSVIFKPKQFSSSFGQYQCSALKELLCPSQSNEFQKWQHQIENIWNNINKNLNFFKDNKKAYFYYLNNHFNQTTCTKKFPTPPWAKTGQSLQFSPQGQANQCVQFYEKIK